MITKKGPSALRAVFDDPDIQFMDNVRRHDLAYVRRQLDELSLVRVMGMMTDRDKICYEELCDHERILLHLVPNRSAAPVTA
ncbi:MAG TPA: hypothetical protein VNC61_13485 [Acidimicrobiales bacterium]|nr:hypothetical protein [Acidimicrobiales bacterium]